MKAQAKQSLLGYLWVVLPPLFQTGIFSLLFEGLLRIEMTDRVPYSLYLYCMALPWQMFANMVSQGTISLVGHAGLVKQVYFPKEVVILAAMSAEGVKTLVASAVLVGFMVYFGIGAGIHLLWLPLVVAIQLLFSLGLVLPFALFNAFARDISKVIHIAISFWMYLTPVVYPLEKVPAEYRSVYLLNPMATLLHSYRQVVLENRMPDVSSLLVAALISAGMFGAGYWVFKRCEALIADII